MEIIKKAFADYAEMAATGKLHGLTPFEVNSIWFILNDLNKGGYFRDAYGKDRKLVFQARLFCCQKQIGRAHV